MTTTTRRAERARSRSSEERDAEVRWRLLTAIALAVATIGLALIYVFTHRPGLEFKQIAAPEAHILLGGLAPIAVVALGEAWAPAMLQAHPILSCLLGGVIWATHFKLTRVDRWLQKRLFSTTRIMTEIGPPRAFDPLRGAGFSQAQAALEWHEPTSGARLAAWSRLRQFAAREAGTGRSSWFGWPVFTTSDRPASYLDFAFRWTVLCGQAGAGKSRMAMEYARMLARSEFFETAPGWRRSAVGVAEWLRRVVPWLRRHRAHPWDVGQIDGGVSDSYLNLLSSWRPRRPTLLLLDDPKPGDCLAVIKRLEESHEQFRYPVRLLIVDQALPAELGFHTVGSKSPWQVTVKAFDGQIIVLDASAGLEFPDVSRIALTLRLPARIWRDPDNPFVRQFLQRTRGNALLVELGLHRIIEGMALEHFDEAELLRAYTERIVRIIDSLKLGGISETLHQHALAAATIAGPVAGDERAVARERSSRAHPINEIFGPLDPRVLERLFNLAQDIGPKEIPPVRPEMVGDAYVRFVLEETCKTEGDEARIIEAAWRTSPFGVLRTISRVGARGDKLALELGLAPPPEVEAGLDSVQLAFAYATAAVRVPRDLWDAKLAGDSAAMLDIATTRIDRLSVGEAGRLLPRLDGLLEPQAELMAIRGWEGLVCVAAATMAANRASGPNPERSKALASAILAGLAKARGYALAQFYHAETVRMAAAAVVVRLHEDTAVPHEEKEAILSEFIVELGHWVSLAMPQGTNGLTQADQVRQLAEALWLSPLKERGAYRHQLNRAWIHLSGAQAGARDVAGCQGSLVRVEQIIDDGFAGLPEFEEQRAQAWVNLGGAQANVNDVGGCHASLLRVQQIIDKAFAGQPKFEQLRARAWVNLGGAQATVGDVVGCHASVVRVEQIVDEGFAGQAEFEQLRARAWVNLGGAQASVGDVVGCHASVVRIEQIIENGFTGQPEFEQLRAAAFNSLGSVQAQRHDAAACQTSVARVEQIIDRTFAGQAAFEEQRAIAWVNLSYAHAALRDTAGCRGSVARVDQIIDNGFAGQVIFEEHRAGAWINLIWLQAELSDVAACRASVARVEQIIGDGFAGQTTFEKQRIIAWLNLGCAQSNVLDVVGCHASVARIEQIIDSGFAGRPEFEALRVKALVDLSYAQSKSRDLIGCQASVARIEQIVDGGFAGQPEFEELRAMARRNRASIEDASVAP